MPLSLHLRMRDNSSESRWWGREAKQREQTLDSEAWSSQVHGVTWGERNSWLKVVALQYHPPRPSCFWLPCSPISPHVRARVYILSKIWILGPNLKKQTKNEATFSFWAPEWDFCGPQAFKTGPLYQFLHPTPPIKWKTPQIWPTSNGISCFF